MNSSRTVLLGAAVLAVLLVSAIAGPVLGQATTPGNATNGSSAANGTGTETGTSYPIETVAPDGQSTPSPEPSTNGSGSNGSNGSAAPTSTATAGAPGAPRAPGAANANASGNGSDLNFGVPSGSDVAGEAVNGTLSALNQVFIDMVGTILKLPWRFITLRFAPFEAATSVGDGGLWQRPPGVFGELYDLATGSFFQLALSLLVPFFVIDWASNLSPKPGVMGVGDRLFRRAGDVAHLLFSWPIIWAHFLLASILCLILLPPDDVVVGGLTGSIGQLAGLGGLVGFTLVFSIMLAIIGGCLFVKHAGAFIYLLAGLVAYPILVVISLPDHPVVGQLPTYAENSRTGTIVSAWYPVPTAFVLGVGYWVDQAVIGALTLGGPLGEASGGAVYYPVLWLAALYAPEKVFGDASPVRRVRNAALAAGTGGAAGAATGATAGTAAGTTAGAIAGSGAGAAGVLPAGAGAGAATGATSAGAGSVSATASRMKSGSPGASALADGGTTAVRSPSGGGSAGPLGDDSAGSRSTSNLGGSGGAGAGSTAQDPDGLTRIGGRDELDTGQRYEPVVQHDSGSLARVDPPKDTNWLADRGGIDRLDQSTDEPLYFRGESDGELYDLRGAANTATVHSTETSNITSGASRAEDSVRNL